MKKTRINTDLHCLTIFLCVLLCALGSDMLTVLSEVEGVANNLCGQRF